MMQKRSEALARAFWDARNTKAPLSRGFRMNLGGKPGCQRLFVRTSHADSGRVRKAQRPDIDRAEADIRLRTRFHIQSWHPSKSRQKWGYRLGYRMELGYGGEDISTFTRSTAADAHLRPLALGRSTVLSNIAQQLYAPHSNFRLPAHALRPVFAR